MYKLVVIAGKIRGQEFELKDEENIIGRDSGCDINVPVAGVSKEHMSITVTDDVAYIEDLKSSNGTFVNGKLIKRATVKNGDKVAIPNTIFQVVYVKEKKVIIKKKVVKTDEEDESEAGFLDAGPPPQALPRKVMYYFKFKLMPIFHGLNHEYEWRVLLGIIMTIFVFMTITLTIFPVLQDSRRLLLWETAKRGAHYADEIARMNARSLERKELDRVDTNFLDTIEDVTSYELFDLEGRIVRPLSKLNQYISDTFSIRAREWALKNLNKSVDTMRKRLGSGEIGIAKNIMAYNVKSGIQESVGVIAIRFKPTSLVVEATKNKVAYLEALSTSAMVAVFIFGIIYYLTVRPLEEMKFQIEEALRNKRRNIEGDLLMTELGPLKDVVNSLLQRNRELSGEASESMEEAEPDTLYVERLGEFMKGAGIPVMVLDSEKNLQRINLEAEDLCGIRENASQGQNLLDVAREQGFAATVIELCDNSANSEGTSQEGEYDLGGDTHAVFVTALMGRDNFAKAFYITMVKSE